ncbi:cytosolic sulfotransferase 1-like [Lycium barbarum]|uniref:cytosolic sulfotransferase 1-like n=1 Tax=Lycium barbarum TaxID=112863 RepID=UPI00293E5B34|nr:cytosolic sulfotransferase 1-like [Lycium barbarum]
MGRFLVLAYHYKGSHEVQGNLQNRPYMKTGTTWLKAICVCIMRGNKEEEDLLIKDIPHFHVPTIEVGNSFTNIPIGDVYTMPSPRLFHTHLPYRVLPDSVKNSDNCKIIYIARNPMDTLISMWHFFNNYKPVEKFFSLEKAIWRKFCGGVAWRGLRIWRLIRADHSSL